MTLEILTSPALAPLRHGFFSRRGGASSGIFKGLNCGFGSSDQSAIVAINRARVAEALDLAPEALQTVNQVHSAQVVCLYALLPSGVPSPKADALVTDRPGIGLAVLTADCQPILLADQEAGVIAAAHAGWRGALDGLIEATVAAMENRGARRDRIAAAIGPALTQGAYEVGPEFFDSFLARDKAHARFFVPGSGDRLQFDLPGFGLAQLHAAGVGRAEWTGHCTYSDPERFYSYRRSIHQGEADYGRLISVIRL